MTKEKFLIFICGLPATGKTTLATKLAKPLGYKLISQSEIRRRMGMRRMPKTQEAVLRKIDFLAAKYLRAGYGVIFESVNRYNFRRHQIYGVASGCGRRVIVLEIVCSEETAKKRMRARPAGDGFLSDPNNPAIYDKLKMLWEEIKGDFKHPGQDHVAYARFNSESKKFETIIPRLGTGEIIRSLKKILKEKE